MTKLSICIPTYNRSDFLIKGLNVWKNTPLSEKVEIVVADDASDDDTEVKVKEFIRKNKKLKIKYHKFNERQYFDKMILSLAGLAGGEYCWLISDDDIPRKDALEKVFEIIDKHPDTALIHMNYTRFDNLVKKITSERMVGDITKDIKFSDPDKFIFMPLKKAYFKFLGTNVITMSTDVVNRKKWMEASKGMEKFTGHNFIHCFIIFNMIKKYPKIYYVGEPIVQYLSNNHRVWPNDIWKDYNNVLLNFLLEIGYDKKQIKIMKEQQKEYEQKEATMKSKYLSIVYKILRPFYYRYQYVKAKFLN